MTERFGKEKAGEASGPGCISCIHSLMHVTRPDPAKPEGPISWSVLSYGNLCTTNITPKLYPVCTLLGTCEVH